MKRKIIRVGSSRGVLLPREVTRAMSWDFGSEIDLTVDKGRREVTLKTIKVSIPDDYDPDRLKQIEDTLTEYEDVLGGIDD